MLKEGCGFCFEKTWDHFAKYGKGNISNFTVAQSPNFMVKPDILPAHPGGLHFVLRPREHYINHLDGDVDELGWLLRGIEKKYGQLAIMKHGDVVEDGGTTLSIRHDHTHLFPSVDIRVVDYMRDVINAQGIEHKIIEAPDVSFLSHLKTQFAGHPYLYVQHGGVGLFVNDEYEQLGTQQIQRAMQRHYNGTTFNWKDIGGDNDYESLSVDRITNLIEKNG